MGDSAKRYRYQKEYHGDNKNQKRRLNEDTSGKDELVAYRILCPDDVIGIVIGKSGRVINSIRQETRAKVKVVDPFPGAKYRVLTIYCHVKEKEEVDVDDDFHDREPFCAAQDALLKVHAAISDAVAATQDVNKKQKHNEKVECQLLVPSSQSANIIGKAGTTIKRLRSKTRTYIKITPKDASDPTHSCAMEFDNFVLINGEPAAVKKALFGVSSIIYKFASKEEIPLETTVPDGLPSIIIPSDVPIFPAGGMYPNLDPIIASGSIPPILRATQLTDSQGFKETGGVWPVYSSALPVVPGFGASTKSEELVIRVLCPFDKIGRVIGKGGGTIKSIRQDTGARIEVDDTKTDRDDCLITITTIESPDDLKSMAVEAVLLLQGKINEEDDDSVCMRLLIPSKVIGCIIGKGGSIINEIRKRTKADIRITKGDISKRANSNDELIEVSGEVANVRDALIQIILRLRDDVLKDREGARKTSVGSDPLHATGSALSASSVLSTAAVAPLGFDQRSESGNGLGLFSSGSLYGYGALPVEDSGYRSMSSHSSKLYGGLPPLSTLEILIPANAVSKVIGKGGQNLSNIRRISGALIEISESKSSVGDRIALISGTPEQKRSAEDLIHAFVMAA